MRDEIRSRQILSSSKLIAGKDFGGGQHGYRYILAWPSNLEKRLNDRVSEVGRLMANLALETQIRFILRVW